MVNGKVRLLILLFCSGTVLSALFTNCSEGGFSASDPANTSGFNSGIGTEGDPLTAYAWHINNTGQKVFAAAGGTIGNDLNLEQTWTDGIYGQGIKILISDDGVEDNHEELSGNFNYNYLSKDYTLASPYTSNRAAPKTAEDSHGTAVAGLIAAMAGNGKGARGVAPKAQIVSANFLSENVSQTAAIVADQVRGSLDIFNMSWGGAQNLLSTPIPGFETQVRFGITNGRSGKGSIYVKAAGNEFFVNCRNSSTAECVGNSNFDAENASPFFIVVGALSAKGVAASYSSGGANLWISSFGGEFGTDTPAMFTTDRMGCSVGFAKSTSTSTITFEKGQNGNAGCNYTSIFNGTSSAAPVMSGAVALMLSVNPNLTWRDVKYILAKTATQVDFVTTGAIGHPHATAGVTLPTGYAWEQVWVRNAAGFYFQNWYGFGRVNVDAAVSMARNFVSPLKAAFESNWANSTTLSSAIPDNAAAGVTSTMAVADNIQIEGVQLRVWATHADISELALELTSPLGTKSIIVNARNAMVGLANYQGETLLSNAFYQESSAGNWTLRVVDAKGGNAGTLTRWSLNFVGGK